MEKQLCTTNLIVDILHEKVGIPVDIPAIEYCSWDELGVDSLGLTETLASLERTLRFSIAHEQAIQTNTIEELVSLINSSL